MPDRSINANYIVSVGSPTQRVQHGTVWLKSYSWNGGEQFQIGTIADGKTHIAFNDRLSPYLKRPPDAQHDNWIVLFHVAPTLWYSTARLDHSSVFSDFRGAVSALGTMSASGAWTTLTLPAPTKRIITLVNLDGTPVAQTTIDVALHVSNADHCAAEQGPELGTYVTDSQGRLVLTLPAQPLMLRIGYFDPDGWWWPNGLGVGPGQSIVVRRDFRYPPPATWHLRVRRQDGAPASNATVFWFVHVDRCGGPPDTQTDGDGKTTLSVTPRLTGSVTITYEGKNYTLSGAQRTALEKNRDLDVTLP